MQLCGELLRAARRRARFAPTEAGAVVGAYPRRRRDLGLDRTPVEGEPSQTSIKHNSWAALPNAVQMQAIATDIHESPRRWIALAVPRCHDRFGAGAAPPTASSRSNASSPTRMRTVQKTKRFGRRRSCGDETVSGGEVIVPTGSAPKVQPGGATREYHPTKNDGGGSSNRRGCCRDEDSVSADGGNRRGGSFQCLDFSGRPALRQHRVEPVDW